MSDPSSDTCWAGRAPVHCRSRRGHRRKAVTGDPPVDGAGVP